MMTTFESTVEGNPRGDQDIIDVDEIEVVKGIGNSGKHFSKPQSRERWPCEVVFIKFPEGTEPTDHHPSQGM